MFDSACPTATTPPSVFRRLIRSLPTRRGVIGVATCDKGLPAMMMALAGARDLPGVLVPGGVTLLAGRRRGRRHGCNPSARASPTAQITLEAGGRCGLCRACAIARRRLPVSGHGGHLAGGGGGAGHVAAALRAGALRPSHLAGHGAALGPRACWRWKPRGLTMRDILTDASVRNAMVVHAAFGGSTNLILHLPAIAHAAGLPRPTVDDWARINRQMPRLVDALPNGPERPSHGAGLPGGRRARSDAASAPRRPARDRRPHRQRAETGRRARLVGAIRTARARCARVLKERDGIDPGRRHHGPGCGARAAASPPPSPSPRAIWRPAAR